MLRKRTSFKPNFTPAPKPPVQQKDTTSQKKDEPPVQTPEGAQTEECNQKTIVYKPTRLDPIKLNLPNSANRNVQLKDLLFKNPPLTKDQKLHKTLAKKQQKKRTKAPGASPQETTSHTLVPQVKMGPDGQLILDEESTVIKRKNPLKSQEAIVEDEEDVIGRTNYDSFRRKPSGSPARWSEEDTQKFYHGLTLFGTDFSIMESILFSGHRDRSEIHKKFKREERLNKKKIDIALSKRISLSKEELDCILIDIKS